MGAGAQTWRRPAFDALKGLFGTGGGQAPGQGPAQGGGDGEEGSDLVPIGSAGGVGGVSDQAFGPLAVLLVGFMEEEVERCRQLLLGMEADMVKIVPATRAIMEGPLAAALEADAPAYERPALGTKRSVILSGMYGGEVVDIIGAWREAGLPPTAFAAAVPNNFERQVRDLCEAVWADHGAMLAAREAQGGLGE